MPPPRRWVVERPSARATRVRRPANNHACLPDLVADLLVPAFAILMVRRLVRIVAQARNWP